MLDSADTIAAIATAPGEAGIAIVRLSGPQSLAIADRIFRGHGLPPSQRPGNSFLHGRLVGAGSDGRREEVDEVILLIYRAPHSYTREDVVEIQGHGGRSCARRVLRAALDTGARLAEPGEFTRRAFVSGRIDLLQAEAVLDLIRASSDRAAAAAVEQLEGRLSTALTAIYDTLINTAGNLEASLDFPEDEVPAELQDGVVGRLDQTLSSINELLSTWEEGHLLREGALVVIAGRPNAGKSTLLNRLLGTERAIVTQVPGTTRDTIEEQIVLSGVPVRLVDTAGLRDVDCEVEREGVERARRALRQADITLYVVDQSIPLGPEDKKQLNELDKDRSIVLLNKADLEARVLKNELAGFEVIVSSLLTPSGVDPVREALVARLGVNNLRPPHAAISERHRSLLVDAKQYLDECRELLAENHADKIPVAASLLRSCIECIGMITGKVYHNNLLDNIFRRFCIGK